MDTKTLKAMADRLQELADGAEPDSRAFGICHSLSGFMRFVDATVFVGRRAREWPEFSGLIGYPVRHKSGAVTGYEINNDRWSGEYGAARRRLCGFLAQKIREEIGDEAN